MAISPSGSFPRRGRGRFQAPNTDEHRINERIRVPEVRLIDENGGQIGVVPTRDALSRAKELGLDLVEMSPNSRPPVCKILDYGKFKYEKKKKEQIAKKKQTVFKVKEVQLRPATDEHDLDYKFRKVKQFLEEGDKAKIVIRFRGREITHQENGHRIMKRLLEFVEDLCTVESPAKMEGRKLMMILAPLTKSAKKSAGAKKKDSKKDSSGSASAEKKAEGGATIGDAIVAAAKK